MAANVTEEQVAALPEGLRVIRRMQRAQGQGRHGDLPSPAAKTEHSRGDANGREAIDGGGLDT